MPHKHKRKPIEDENLFDLPPTARAKPLTPFQRKDVKVTTINARKSVDKKLTKRKTDDDDTPKQFARLMRFATTGKRLPSGLDDGNSKPARQGKKRKRVDVETTSFIPAKKTPAGKETAPPTLQIQPGERLADFAARVDQSLPLSQTTTSAKLGANIKSTGRPTKHTKRLLRMQKEWREAEAWRKARQQEELEEKEDQLEQDSLLWAKLGSSKKTKKGRLIGEVDDEGNEDPWKVLEKKRAGAKMQGLHDVVLAPPTLGNLKGLDRFKKDKT